MSILDASGQYEPLDKYISHTVAAADSLSLGEQIASGAIATVVDIGATYWNSLTPEKYNTTTTDLLSRIDQNALQVYNENTDLIQTASFIGGLVAPVGLSIKGMNLLRAGTKGFSWFSEAGQAAQLAKVESSFARAGRDAEFVKAKWEMYRGVAYNAIVDNTAAELAIVGTLSSHPFMEDYNKDFSSNFLKSVAFGTGIQTGIGSILAKTSIAKATGEIEKEATKIIKSEYWDPIVEAATSQRSHLGELAAAHSQGVERLKSIVAEADGANPKNLKPFTVETLRNVAIREEAALVGKLKEATTGELAAFLKDAPQETTERFLSFVAKVENAGLDKISFAKVEGETAALAKGQTPILQQEPSLIKKITKTVKDAFGVEKQIEQFQKTDAIYLSTHDRYVSKADGPLYMNVADLGKTIEQMEQGISSNLGKYPNADWAVELGATHTAIADSHYAEAILAVEKWTEKDFANAIVDPDHLPMLKAIYARAAKVLEENPDAKLKIKLTKEKPSWDAVQQAALVMRGGVAPTYVKDITAIEKEMDKFAVFHPDRGVMNDPNGLVSFALSQAIDRWIGGNYGFLRGGAFFQSKGSKSIIDKIDFETQEWMRKASDVLDEFYHLPASKAFRERLQKLADVDGNVWLYRGLHAKKAEGHNPLESYTLTPEKAGEFGSVNMYKVHVDDIYGTFYDIGEGRKSEILVRAPTRDAAKVQNMREVPDEIVIKQPEFVNVGIGKTAEVTDLAGLGEALSKAQTNLMYDLVNKNFGIETIALKTGTPEETVARILETGRADIGGLLKYTNKEDVIAALDTTRRSLALSTDMNKIPQPELFAELNKRNLDDSSKGILEYYLLSSHSPLVRSFGEALLSQDMKTSSKALYDELANLVSSNLKSSLVSSTNQVLEGTGSLGMIANYLGKETIRLKNQLTETFEKPIATLMAGIIKKGDANLIEANTSFAVNASISGPRFYKNGSFWIPSANAKNLPSTRELIAMSDKDFAEFLSVADEGALTKATYKGMEYNIVDPTTREMWDRLQQYGREMYEFKNARFKAIGKQGLNDIGLWVPSFNPRNKSIAYVHDLVKDSTSMIYADTDELLATAIKGYEDSLRNKYGENWRSYERIVPKSMQEEYNMLAGRHDSLYMQAADLTKQHGGASTPTIVSTDTTVFQDVLQGYQEHVHQGIEGIMEITMNDTMNMLKTLSDSSKGLYATESKGVLSKLSSKPVDPGQTVRNIILGRPMLSEHKAWSEFQQRAQVGTDLVLRSITELFQPLLAPVAGKLSGAKQRTATEWDKIVKEMDQKGIVNPFDGLDKEFGLGRYLTEGKGNMEGLTPRAIALGNATAATLILRVGELAQPLVNALSLPILTSAAVNRKMASSFMGETLDPTAKFAISSAMMDGIRLMNHPIEGTKWSKLAEEKGIFSIELRNVTELLEHQRSLDPGLMAAAEKGLESSLSKMLSKPADLSESFVRRSSFFTGIGIAKKAYPGISDTGAMIFARNFMDEAIGNYTAAQRPALFQGTFGVAMGLFQTYMLTMAQAMYRQVQNRDWKSLGKMLLTQSTVFGASSLPGFHNVSEAIATNFSDNHIDLETGTFRAIGDPAANILLYGAPSSFGPGIVTRGDIQPRIPNPFTTSNIALVNLTQQSYDALERVAQAAYNADESAGKAILEAISLQSISRPVARLSELAVGRSITSRGDIVATDLQPTNLDNLFSLSTLSRVMSTRPLEEIKAREALHLNTIYGAADSEKRRAVTSRLKSHIRNGDLDSEVLDKLAEQYMRTGSSVGWRAAVADAIQQAGQSGDATTLNKLKKNSPLQMMIEDLE